MTFQLPALPYDYSALEPHLSARTLEFHHDKHHATYVNTLNNLTQDTPLGDQSLETIIKATYEDHGKISIFSVVPADVSVTKFNTSTLYL